MSRGPGHVERAIEAVLRDTDRSFSVEELALIAYPNIDCVQKKHRVAVLRALSNVQDRVDLWFFDTNLPPWRLIILRLGSVQSHVHGWFRHAQQDYSLAQIGQMMEVEEIRDAMAPGGYFWCQVEFNKVTYVDYKKLGFKDGMPLAEMSPELRSVWGLGYHLKSYVHGLPVQDSWAFVHIAKKTFTYEELAKWEVRRTAAVRGNT
jgi:hypothetical protein